MSDKVLIYVKAANDVNGNPRQGWIVTWRDGLFVDEGYAGRWALYRALGNLDTRSSRLQFDRDVHEFTLEITAKHYNALKRGK